MSKLQDKLDALRNSRAEYHDTGSSWWLIDRLLDALKLAIQQRDGYSFGTNAHQLKEQGDATILAILRGEQ